MINKNVIRRKNENGKFTTIHNSIINDNRLTSNSLRLLISILSDNDEKFNLSQQTYCNRLNWDKRIFFKAIENLEDTGYLKRTEIGKDKAIPGMKKKGSNKKIYKYTVSEYGNLKKETPKTEESHSEEIPVTQPKIRIEDYNDLLINEIEKRNVIGENIDVMGVATYINKAYKEGKITNSEQLSVSNLNRIIDKFKQEKIKIEIVSNKRVEEILQEKISGLTQKDVTSLRMKIMNRVKENPSMTEKEISTQILQFKTEFRKTAVGNQD